MKFKGLTMVCAILILLMISACSPTSQKVSSSEAQETGAPHSSAVENDKVKVVHTEMGDITVPESPQRVIGLSVVYPELLYALGVVPVAAQNYHSEFPAYLQEPFSNTLKMGIARTPDFEAILEAGPDLIIAPAWWSKKDYDQLSQIAPTVLLPEYDDWRDELRDMAAILGKEDQAEQVMQDLEQHEKQGAETLHSLIGDETVLYIRVMEKEIVLHGENIDRGSFIHKQLALKSLPNFPKSENAMSVSLEVLPEYDADHLIVQLDDETNQEIKSKFEEMLTTSLWKNLKAVKNDHVYMVGGKEWFNLGMSPLADNYVIDDIVAAFREKN
ncbi:ABC transporter substrate-binding protein [Paenibacillus pabuli]|uniref:ABC transporter substrate-binding protein n=1 Tax=Paenibacillus pabuli TaxID=1472 RepID=UPI000785A935|nr:ABC transporter substrate-binding protein [Paenibacillus pabuli]MEC0127647.1 ABC transporter substrate-binding protein [Paenibacillus pabuli]